MIVLGIETSCDETAAAICQNGVILSNIVSTQTLHSKYGGVVPELASREHEKFLNYIVAEALKKAKIKPLQLDGIAVTQGPGLAGTLLTGVCFAKGLALGLGCPILGLNHLEAHIYANFLEDPTLEYPLICLLISGGHTQLWHVKSLGNYSLLGESRDDAAGEAFDKGARILGLGYPGGPAIENLSIKGKIDAVNFPRALMKPGNFEFSFSGIKTSLLYFMDKYHETQNLNLADVAASYQEAILDALVRKLALAVKDKNVKTCIVAGGVAANLRLRKIIHLKLPNTRIIFPELALCTDNAAMVAFLGELYFQQGKTSNLDFPILPNMRLD